MRSIFSRLLIAAAAVLLGTALVQSQTTDDSTAAPPAPMHHSHEFRRSGFGGPTMGFFADKLGLTDAQRVQMKTIMEKERPAMKPLFAQNRAIEQQLHQYAEGSYDEAKVRTLATQQAQIQADLTVQKTRIHNEMFQVLTPDQQAQLKELEASRAARRQARGHQPPPAPPDQQ